MPDIYDFSVEDIHGKKVSLARYRGKVLLIVNTASKCGFTPQYKGLEALYRSHGKRGLVILGFPCNQFGAQEPGTEQEIASFSTMASASRCSPRSTSTATMPRPSTSF